MRDSDRERPAQALRRAIAAALIFVIVVAAASFPVIRCYVNGSSIVENDLHVRDGYAGTLDTLFIGGSQVQYAVIPAAVDQAAGTSSYNMSCAWQNLYSEILLARHELGRNPVTHVYIGVCLDTVTRTEETDKGQGEIIAIPRLAGTPERLDYLAKCGRFGDLPAMYYYYMHYGLISLLKHVRGIDDNIIDPANRGYVPYLMPQEDMSRDELAEMSVENYHKNGITADNRQRFIELVQTCADAGAEVTVIATPLAQVMLERYDIWQDFLEEIAAMKDEAAAAAGLQADDIELWDFNLYRGISGLLSDETDFYNWTHMNKSGSEKLAPVLAEVISRHMAGESVEELFYAGYDECAPSAR